MTPFAYILQIFSCFCLTGLIWIIQIIHNPSFKFVHPAKFAEFHSFHTTKITLVVGPLMALELFTAGFIFFDQKMSPISLVNLGTILLIWGGTAFLSVPLHNKLAKGIDTEAIEALIRTNWVRTFLWSARSGLIIYYLTRFN